MRPQNSPLESLAIAASGERLPDAGFARSAHCDAMGVSYTSGFGEPGFAPLADRILVVVPEGDGVLQASYTPADGRPRRAVVRAPALCVVPANQPHRIWSDLPVRVLTMSLSPAFQAECARHAFGAERPVVENYAAEDRFLRGIANALMGAFRAGQEPSPRYLEAMASTVALHLANHYHSGALVASPATGLAAHKLQRVLALIEQRLAEPVQVKELAQAIHMSPFHFARMFKLATGLPPHGYITQQRMERAKALLAFTDIALVDVATQVGYQTQAHFTGVFHRHVGITPRSYRRGARVGGDPAAAAPAATAPVSVALPVPSAAPQPAAERHVESGA